MEVLRLTIILGLWALVTSVPPVPKRQVGYVYNEGSATARVKLDVYLDQVCPNSRDAWPTLLSVADHYGPQRLRLRTLPFSLTYLRNGFLASKGSYIVHQLSNVSTTYDYISKVFSNYDSLTREATTGLSDNQIIDKLADIAAELGLRKAEVMSLFDTWPVEWSVRVTWKHAASRRIFGAPTFMVNDVKIAASYTWTLADWRNYLDPLLGIQQSTTTPKPPTDGSGRVQPLDHMWAWLFTLTTCVLIYWR